MSEPTPPVLTIHAYEMPGGGYACEIVGSTISRPVARQLLTILLERFPADDDATETP